jgi:dUTP pyrophosphatase
MVLNTDIFLFTAWCTFAALMTTTPLFVRIINRSPYPLPQYETSGSAGMDLRANLESPVTLSPLERALIPTGLFIELPNGYEAQIRPRSGLAIKRGLTMLNSPGTIDSDYRGEIKCIVVNLSNEVQTIEPGERVAQMVVARHEQVQWQPVEQLPDSERGAGGFGSTGK